MVPILFFVPTWSPIGTSTSTEAATEGISLSLASKVSRHEEKVTIELDIFSGRPNPSWELRGQRAHALLQMLDRIRHSGPRHQPCFPPDLGYRGVVLRIQLQPDWRLFGGCAQWDDKTFQDPARKIEAYLLKSMPEQLSKELSGVLPQINQ